MWSRETFWWMHLGGARYATSGAPRLEVAEPTHLSALLNTWLQRWLRGKAMMHLWIGGGLAVSSRSCCPPTGCSWESKTKSLAPFSKEWCQVSKPTPAQQTSYKALRSAAGAAGSDGDYQSALLVLWICRLPLASCTFSEARQHLAAQTNQSCYSVEHVWAVAFCQLFCPVAGPGFRALRYAAIV